MDIPNNLPASTNANLAPYDMAFFAREANRSNGASWEPIFSLQKFLRVLMMRRAQIIRTIAVVIVLTIVLLVSVAPQYTGQAIVMIDQQKNNVADGSAALSQLPTDPASMQNQVQILKSRELAERVIDKLGLQNDPEFADSQGFVWPIEVGVLLNLRDWLEGASAASVESRKAEALRRVVDKFEDRLSVSIVGASTTIAVNFEANSPNRAARIANALADAYVAGQLDAKFQASQRTTAWLTSRIKQLAVQAETAQDAVERYKAENGITDTSQGNSVVGEQLATLNGQLISAKTDLAEKQAIYLRVTELARSGKQADIAQVVSSPLIMDLRSQEAALIRKKGELSTRYGPRFPKMIDLKNERKDLEAKIYREVRRIVESVKSDVSVAAAKVASLEQSLKQLEGQSKDISKASVKLRALQVDADTARSTYQAFLSRLKEMQDQRGLQTPDARIISQATAPASPSFPPRKLALAASLPLGLALGLLIAFAAEKFGSGYRTDSEIEAELGLPVLASVPELEANGDDKHVNAADYLLDNPLSSFAEAIRGLQFGVTLSNPRREPRTIVVTSSVPDEGKTTIAISLARLAAENGKRAIVVDADLRMPQVAAFMNCDCAERGIVDVLNGSLPLEHCLFKDSRSDALVLPGGPVSGDSARLAGSKSMQTLLKDLARVFDVVIVDCPPVLPVNDGRILSTFADAVVFVTRWDKTSRNAVISAIRSLSDARAKFAGVALTRADPKRYSYYAYGNYYGYGGYRGG